ncbi:MAG: DUF1232 domain-containing protein [Pseudomonadota bacterium]|nr:DUF1232 domain-containing protein [Pseudomonadota bacterium]
MWKRLSTLWTVIRGDARLMLRAWKHPGAPAWFKPAVVVMGLYVVSPIDLIPDTIPLIGVLDDLVLVPLAMRFLLGRLPVRVRADIGGRHAA